MNKQLFAFLVWILLMQQSFASDKSDWIITTRSTENYNGVTLANGRIGLVSGAELFNVTDIVLNGVYDKEDKEGVSRIVRGPVFTNLILRIDGEDVTPRNTRNWQQSLNMKEAYLETTVEAPKAIVSQSLRALRNFPYMGLSLVTVIPTQDIELEVINSTLFPSELKETSATYKMLQDGKIELPVYTSTAKSRTGMQDLATCSAFLFDTERPEIRSYYGTAHQQSMGFNVRLKKGESYRFCFDWKHLLLARLCQSACRSRTHGCICPAIGHRPFS